MYRISICLLTIVLGAMVAACAPIQHRSASAQPVGRVLLVGPGDLMLRVDRERDLQNAFGRADLFGRKTYEGFTEVRFAGVEPDGSIVLYRKDVTILTNETTMSRTPILITSGSAVTTGSARATTSGNQVHVIGSATTTGVATTIQPQSAYTIAVPSDTIPIRLQRGERRVHVAGYLIEVLAVTGSSLEFRVGR